MNVFSLATLVFALLQTTRAPLKFEVASVKLSAADASQSSGCHSVDAPRATIALGRCVFHHTGIRQIIKFANPDLDASFVMVAGLAKQVSGGPDWIDHTFFDIEAKAEDPSSATLDQLREMLLTLLKDRFQLAFHRETRELPGYSLVVAKDGFKLKEASGPLTPAEFAAFRKPGDRTFFANNMTLTDYASLLSVYVKDPVVNKTNVSGKYNIFLKSAETGDETAASIFTAVQEQLGLKLEPEKKLSFEIIVIDRAEKPTENPGGSYLQAKEWTRTLDSLERFLSTVKVSQ